MKAEINGIQVECTPEEFVKTMELIGKIEQKIVVKYIPAITTAPNWQEPYITYRPNIICDKTTTVPNDYVVWNL